MRVQRRGAESAEDACRIIVDIATRNGVKKVAFIAGNESDPLSQRDSGAAAARALGLEVVSDTVTYQMDTTDFTPVLLPVIQTAPDLLVLSGVSPANARASSV